MLFNPNNKNNIIIAVKIIIKGINIDECVVNALNWSYGLVELPATLKSGFKKSVNDTISVSSYNF